MKTLILFKNKDLYFKLLLLITFVFILYSNPFLRFPYDPWEFLISIENIYGFDELPSKRGGWYIFWANFFYLFSIDDFFYRAKIIHIVQTIICLSSVYFFSHVVIRNLFKHIDKQSLSYLSYWSAIIWVTIFSTFSVYYHQVWLMWYSVTYQVSLAFFWYITGLTVILLCEKNNMLIKWWYIIQIAFLSYLILIIHPMELVYYLMYLILLVVVFFKKIIFSIKDKYYTAIILFLTIGWAVYTFFDVYYLDKTPQIFKVWGDDGLTLGQVYNEIMMDGKLLVDGENRASSAINELMFVCLFICGGGLSALVWSKMAKKNVVFSMELLIFCLISAGFVCLPLIQLSAGILSTIAESSVVNRFYYSSSIYIIIPIGVYYAWFLYNKKVNLLKTNISIVSILLLTFCFSAYSSSGGNYYKNIKSIYNSFDGTTIDFHLSSKQIKNIGELLELYEQEIEPNGRPIIYYARADIAFIIKYIYKRDVYWIGRRHNPTINDFYNFLREGKVSYFKTPVIFKTPLSFPNYEIYK